MQREREREKEREREREELNMYEILRIDYWLKNEFTV